MTTPTVDLPFDEALQELTGFEVIGIEKHYGDKLEHLGGVRSLCGAVWAFRSREAKTSWSDVEGMTLRELAGFFAEPTPDPESDQGKESPSPETRLNGSLHSASPPATALSSTAT